MERREGQVTDEFDIPVPTATIYVFREDGTEADLTIDGTTPLIQPVTTDDFGVYSYYANSGTVREDIYYAGKLRYREVIPVGLDGLYPLSPRGGSFFAFDADENPIASSGTGADAGLRTDLAANSGFSLIKHKLADANTFGRSAASLAAVGGEADHNIMHWIDPAFDDALIAGTNSTDVRSYILNAIAAFKATQLSTGRRQRLVIPPFIFQHSNTIPFDCPDLVVDARGAKFTTPMVNGAPQISLPADNVELHGLHCFMSGGSDVPWIVEVTGNNVKLLNRVKLEKPEGTPGTTLYARAGVSGLRMIGCETAGSNGFNVFGLKDAVFAYNRFIERAAGGDDAIALKSIVGQGDGITENVVIAYNYFENCSAFCSVGSEIGGNGVNDPTRSAIVRNFQVIGNRGKNCLSILYVKPGQIQNYRDGSVSGGVCSDNVLEDPTGTKMDHIINIAPGRGGSVENIKGKNNLVIGRTNWTGGAAVGYRVFVQDDTGVGSSQSAVRDIDIGLTIFDPYKGVASGGAAPGSPFSNAASISLSNTAYGTIAGVTVDVECNGTLNSGVVVNAGLDDAVFVRRAKLANINNDGSAVFGGISTTSRLEVGLDITIDMANGQPYVFPTVGAGEVRCPALDRQVYYGTQGALATPALAAWKGPRRCALMAVDMLTSNTLAQDASNYTQIALANMGLAGTAFASWASQTGSPTGSSKLSAATANALTPVYRRRDVTIAADMAQALFARDALLKFTKSNGFASGAALNDTRFEVRCAPY